MMKKNRQPLTQRTYLKRAVKKTIWLRHPDGCGHWWVAWTATPDSPAASHTAARRNAKEDVPTASPNESFLEKDIREASPEELQALEDALRKLIEKGQSDGIA